MRVVFAGTPEFARIALARIHLAGFDIPLVLTQPDRPAGRGMGLQASGVKQWAVENGVSVCQPRSLRLDGKYPADAAAARAAIQAADADVMVVAAYGLILPQWLLNMMSAGEKQRGCLNIHASLLPRWRGAAPIHRAVEAGDAVTGVTIMQMDAGLDTGDMLLAASIPVEAGDSTGTLHDKLADLGGHLVVDAINAARRGKLHPVKQPAAGVSYAEKISKHEALIDWSQSASLLERRIRAFDPAPGAKATLAGETLKLWRSKVWLPDQLPVGTRPGQVLRAGPDGIDVATGDAALRLVRLQRPGGKALEAAEFLRGFPVSPGMVFDAA